MPKRRRLLTPMKKKSKWSKANNNYEPVDVKEESIKLKKDESTPRGRLKGALLDALDPAEESESSVDHSRHDETKNQESSEDEDKGLQSPPRQSYVLKLFDRSVDLSQFEENSPLYPICRAWMINQPKVNYKKLGKKIEHIKPLDDNSVELPGPVGPPVSRIPELLPEQAARSKDNINLNYEECPTPSKEYLLTEHLSRWNNVRRAWAEQAVRVEARYHDTQQLLNRINNSY